MRKSWMLALALAAAACGGEEPASPPKAATATAAAPPAPPPAPQGFTWTETPTVDMAPAAPLTGVANGRPFEARAVLIEPGLKSWKLSIHDQPLRQPTGLLMNSGHLDINLPEPPAAGKKFEKPMRFGDGYWQVKKPGEAAKTTSWNAPNAYALELTKWEVAPWDPDGPVFQDAGRASGRLVVVYQGGAGGFENSWVAGTFEDAVVRYMGKPFWEKAAAKAAPPAADAGVAAP